MYVGGPAEKGPNVGLRGAAWDLCACGGGGGLKSVVEYSVDAA